MAPSEIEWLLKEASDLMQDSGAATHPQAAAFSANSAIVNLLGALLEEVALLREDFANHFEREERLGTGEQEADEAEFIASWAVQTAARQDRRSAGVMRAGHETKTSEQLERQRALRARIAAGLKAGEFTRTEVRNALRNPDGFGSLDEGTP